MINETDYHHNKGPFRWSVNGEVLAQLDRTNGFVAQLPHQGINPKAYPFNAKGDGVADDTVAILNAIDSISASLQGGFFLFFPPGIYRVTQPLVITSRWMSFLGSGALLGPNGSRLYCPDADVDIITSATQDSFSMRDMVIWGANAGAGTGRGLVLGTSGNSAYTTFSSQVRNCWFTNIPTIAIDMLNCADVRVEGGTVENSGVGIKIHGATYAQGGGNVVSGVTVYSNIDGIHVTTDAGGAAAQYTENVRIHDCLIETCGTNPGGVGDDTHGGIIVDAVDLSRAGIRGLQITGNQFRGCVGDIRMNGRDGVAGNNTGINCPLIGMNTSDRGFREFLMLNGVNRANVGGNIVDSCNQEGLVDRPAITVTGTSDRTFLNGNTVNNLPSSPYQPSHGLRLGASTTNTILGTNRWDGKTGATDLIAGYTTLAAN